LQLLGRNVVYVASLNLCWMFSDNKVWTSQLSSLLGHLEVEVFSNKLRSLNVTGLEELKLSLEMFFGEQDEEVRDTVGRVVSR